MGGRGGFVSADERVLEGFGAEEEGGWFGEAGWRAGEAGQTGGSRAGDVGDMGRWKGALGMRAKSIFTIILPMLARGE